MDPFTIAAGISALGSLFKGASGVFGGLNEQKAEQNAATQHEEEAGVNASNALQEGDEATARAATQVAANGGGFVGSSVGVLNGMASKAMFNARTQVYRGQTQAQADLYSGQVAKAQGIDEGISGAIDAGSSLAGGFMRSAQFSQYRQLLGQAKGLGADSPYDYASVPY